jgi:hypothetical protein
MRKLGAAVLACLWVAVVAHSQIDFLKERNEGFMPIFNNVDLQGWKTDDEELWKVADSMMIAETGARLIETAHDAFASYALRFEWKISPQGHAAVLLRGNAFDRAAVTLADRPEGSGGMDALKLKPLKRMDNPVGEWNQMEIIVSGNTVTVKGNNQVVLNKTALTGLPVRGVIAFQNFGATLSLRSIRLKPLDLDLPFFTQKVQLTFRLQCIGCHTGENNAAKKMSLQVPEQGVYNDDQILSDYLEAAKRVKPGKPDESLLLNKALGKVPHGGGTQISANSPDYKAFVGWVQGETLKK